MTKPALPVFSFCRTNTWEQLEPWFESCPDGSEFRWVTYSFEPPVQLLEYLKAKGFTGKFLSRHPADDRISITKDAWRRLNERFHEVGELYGAHALDLSDGEEFGPLHAKLVVVRSPSKRRYWLATGSFNVAASHFYRNSETVAFIDDNELAKKVWEQVEDILASEFCRLITIDDCVDSNGTPGLGKGSKAIDVTIPDGPFRGEKPVPAGAPKIDPATYSPIELRAVKQALDEMLQKWPSNGKAVTAQGWQWDVFQDLNRRREQRIKEGQPDSDVLYLPVGLGKTFIAFRWLLEHMQEKDTKAGRYVVFLAPNPWVQASVRRDLDKVITHAVLVAQRTKLKVTPEKITQAAKGYIQVLRPSEVQRVDKRQLLAMVTDECHNWNPAESHDPKNTRIVGYTSALNHLRGTYTVPCLGLSATPCRADKNRFVVRDFVHAFNGMSLSEMRVAPNKTLRSAIDDHLLTPPRFIRLAADLHGAIKRELTSDQALVQWGDYSKITLRRVWDLLDGRRERLVDEILEQARKADSRRALVFVPPVGEACDLFVTKLEEKVAQFGKGHFVDFRSRSIGAQEAMDAFTHFSKKEPNKGMPVFLVTTDRFAEGVSVTDIDLLVMLRATLSPRVAVQALGRGLRLDSRKTECVVLDAVCFGDRLDDWESGVVGPEPNRPLPLPLKKVPEEGVTEIAKGYNLSLEEAKLVWSARRLIDRKGGAASYAEIATEMDPTTDVTSGAARVKMLLHGPRISFLFWIAKTTRPHGVKTVPSMIRELSKLLTQRPMTKSEIRTALGFGNQNDFDGLWGVLKKELERDERFVLEGKKWSAKGEAT